MRKVKASREPKPHISCNVSTQRVRTEQIGRNKANPQKSSIRKLACELRTLHVHPARSDSGHARHFARIKRIMAKGLSRFTWASHRRHHSDLGSDQTGM